VKERTVIIIGAGLAGLSTGCYAQMNGYRSHIFEHPAQPGGVAAAWQRGDYLIDGGRYQYALDWQKLKYHHFSRQPVRACVALVSLALKHPAWTFSHFLRSAPNRAIHEWRMNRESHQRRH